MRAGSLVVNSSQGGGTKDTWVLQSDAGIVPDGSVAEPSQADIEAKGGQEPRRRGAHA